jgi:hypothetical protein
MDPLNVQKRKQKINLKQFLFFIFLKILSKFVGHGNLGSTKPHLSKAMLHNSQPKKDS